MGTDANKGILKEAGLLSPEAEAASPNDLVIAVSGEGRYPAGSAGYWRKASCKKGQPRALRQAAGDSNPGH